MTTQNKTMAERLAEKVCNAVLEVTDGKVQLNPIDFLTYQDEPVGEFENLKSFIQSEIALAIDNRNREVEAQIRKEVVKYVYEETKDPTSDNYIYATYLPLSKLDEILSTLTSHKRD